MNQSIDGAMKNPSSATAVRKQLNNVILPVPRRSTTLLLNRLDTNGPSRNGHGHDTRRAKR